MTLFNYTKETNEGTVTNAAKVVAHVILGTLVTVVGLILIFGSWTTISAGERGIVLRLGEVDRVLDPGFHMKRPFVERIVNIEVRVQKIEVEATAASKDLQIVTTNVALNYHLDPIAVGTLYDEIGLQFKSRIIDPAIQDAVKAATAKFNAEALITRRAEVKDEIEATLRKRLSSSYIVVKELSIVNFQFSEQFDTAIEAKVTALQSALEAENKLRQVEFEAQQRIEKAKAEAEAITIQARAINSQGGEDYVELQRIEKWDGRACTSYCGMDTSTGLLINR